MPRLPEMPQRRSHQGEENKTVHLIPPCNFKCCMNFNRMLFDQIPKPYFQSSFLQTDPWALRPIFDQLRKWLEGLIRPGPLPLPIWNGKGRLPLPKGWLKPSPRGPPPPQPTDFPIGPPPSDRLPADQLNDDQDMDGNIAPRAKNGRSLFWMP